MRRNRASPLRERDWRKRKARLDAAAAAIILQDFLDGARIAERIRRSVFAPSCWSRRRRGAWWMQRASTTPYRGFAGDEVFVDLPPGIERLGIAERLADAGVVPDALTFRLAARWRGPARRLQAGEYRFAEPASPLEIVARLAQGDVYTRSVTFPEGLTIREMAADLRARADSARAASSCAPRRTARASATSIPKRATLEGFLFPSTYSLPRRAGADALPCTRWSRSSTHAFDATLRAAAAAHV